MKKSASHNNTYWYFNYVAQYIVADTLFQNWVFCDAITEDLYSQGTIYSNAKQRL